MKKILVVIDIQERYSKHFNATYLSKVERFIRSKRKSYDKIISMIDLGFFNKEGDNVPCFLEEFTDELIFKMYNETYTKDHILKFNAESYLLNQTNNYLELQEGCLFIKKENDCFSVDYIDDQFYNVFKNIDHRCFEIDVIGGIDERCVKKTCSILKSLGFKVRVIKPLCYKDRFSETSFIKQFKKYCLLEIPLDIISWTFKPNNNKPLEQYLKKVS